MPSPLLDTNVLLRHITGDHAELTPRARAFIGRVQAGEISVRISDQAVFETAHTMMGMYRATREDVRDAVLPFIRLPNVLIQRKSQWDDVFALFLSTPLSLVDSYHVVLMSRLRITEIVSFDRDFDRVPGITRIEP